MVLNYILVGCPCSLSSTEAHLNILKSFKLLLFLDMEMPNSLHVKPSHSIISEDYNSMKTVGVKLSMWWRLNEMAGFLRIEFLSKTLTLQYKKSASSNLQFPKLA